MKTLKKYPWQIISCILLLIVILQRQCTPVPDPVIITETRDSIITQKVIVEKEGKVIYKPLPYAVKDTVHDTIFRTHEDTVKAMQDYQLTRSYKLPLFDDSTGKIDVFATVHQNSIQSWYYKGQVINMHTTNDRHHYVKELPRTKVYLGLGVGGWVDKVGLAPSAAVNTKKDHLYTGSFDVINKTAWVHTYWKLKFKVK